ncbi:MAG TPA: DUF2461 domain-containing protein [Chitinophagaceae bacterium]|nr:DUF2461 domain-containing protein [Chitinophagaceae bacterium]
MLQPATIQFLRGLKKNNTKEWFDANRKQYDAAKDDFAALVKTVIAAHAKSDETIASLQPKDCLFRINRDIRFSKDKSPYKTNFGAFINRGGKKSIYAGYYFHCEPGGGSFAGGGLWMPEPENLAKVRQEIDYSFDEFKKIVTGKKFINIYGDLHKGDDVILSREPKGYEKNNPAIEFIKLKSFIAMRPVTDEELTGKELVKTIAAAYSALQPLVGFINRALE